MPDNPSVIPGVTVAVDYEVVTTVRAQILRPLLREQGLHETGMCGFVVDVRNCPEIAHAQQVELFDAETNVRIYRRPPAAAIGAKLFRLETQLLRNALLNEVFDARFHMAFTRLEALPEETIKAILGATFSGSTYASGCLYLRAYDALLRDRQFKICMSLRDPFEELAEQLLIMQWAAGRPEQSLGSVLPESFVKLSGMMPDDLFTSPKRLDNWLDGLPGALTVPLTSPITRLLTCLNADELPARHAVSEALDRLSEMAAVGFRSEPETFLLHVEAALDAKLPSLESPALSPRVHEVSEMVRQLPSARRLLAADVALYQAAKEAWASARIQEPPRAIR